MEIQVHSSPEGLTRPVRVVCCCGEYEDGWVEKIPGLPRREYVVLDDENKVVESGLGYDGEAVRAMGGVFPDVTAEHEGEEPAEENGVEARGKKKRGGSRRGGSRKGTTSRPRRRRSSWVS